MTLSFRAGECLANDLPQTTSSRLCGMLRSESSSGCSGAMLSFSQGKRSTFQIKRNGVGQ